MCLSIRLTDERYPNEAGEMTTPTIHNSRYGMAVPTPTEQVFQLRSVTSMRWRTFTSAMQRVVDGVRMESDEVLSELDGVFGAGTETAQR